MPHPHEQKLHDVVNSTTLASLRERVAALTAGTSTRPPSARPTPLPTADLSQSRRLMVELLECCIPRPVPITCHAGAASEWARGRAGPRQAGGSHEIAKGA